MVSNAYKTPGNEKPTYIISILNVQKKKGGTRRVLVLLFRKLVNYTHTYVTYMVLYTSTRKSNKERIYIHISRQSLSFFGEGSFYLLSQEASYVVSRYPKFTLKIINTHTHDLKVNKNDLKIM